MIPVGHDVDSLLTWLSLPSRGRQAPTCSRWLRSSKELAVGCEGGHISVTTQFLVELKNEEQDSSESWAKCLFTNPMAQRFSMASVSLCTEQRVFAHSKIPCTRA